MGAVFTACFIAIAPGKLILPEAEVAIAEPIELLPEKETPIEQPQSAATPQLAEAPQPVIPLAAEPELKVHGDEITMWQGDRKYRVRGLGKNASYEVMKVNVLVARQEEFHVDTFDMHLDRQRA